MNTGSFWNARLSASLWPPIRGLSSRYQEGTAVAVDPQSLVFGPVRSGRLGASLGLDLLGAKICSFDCLYCEVGVTRALTGVRKPYVPADKLLGELAYRLFAPHAPFDVITLGGMGEPTLNSQMGEIIKGVRELAPGVPVAVLTNSSLMADPHVRAELALADMVLPSMDSLIPAEFNRINRPQPGTSLTDIRQGLLAFGREYPGKIFLEVLVLAGVNDSEENLARLEALCRELNPHRVDVVTMTRPGAYIEAQPAPPATLERFRQVLSPLAQCGEIPEKARQFGSALDSNTSMTVHVLEAEILQSLSRRPQTAAQLAQGLGVDEIRVAELLPGLVEGGRASWRMVQDQMFYFSGDLGRL